MSLVQTLVVRDEADIVGHQIANPLDAGIDFVIAMDHESRDGTTKFLGSTFCMSLGRRREALPQI